MLYVGLFVINYFFSSIWVFFYEYSRFTGQQKNGRSSRSQMFCKIGNLRNFAMFTGKHLCWSLFFNKEKETPTQVFPCDYLCEFFRTASLIEHPWWLLLEKEKLFL